MGARARLRVSARVSPGWCARRAPGPGSRTQGSPAVSPPPPGRSRQLCLPPVPEPFSCLRGPMPCVCDCVVCVRARGREGVCPQRPPPRSVSFGSMLLPLAAASSGGTHTRAHTHTYASSESHLTDSSTCPCGDTDTHTDQSHIITQPHTPSTDTHTSQSPGPQDRHPGAYTYSFTCSYPCSSPTYDMYTHAHM